MRTKRHSPRRFSCSPARAVAGVTLIELMIAVAIVAILAAIAYPSYQSYVGRTHRNAAVACLSQYQQFMERYYTTNLRYFGADPLLACRNDNHLDRRYEFTVSIPAPPNPATYTITATPTYMQSPVDGQCGALTINETGARDALGPALPNSCW